MDDIVKKNIDIHRQLVSEFETYLLAKVKLIASEIIHAFKNGNHLYLCGNGGSAADAQHVAGEFVGRFRNERKALPAIALSTDTSVLTCIGNDYSYSDIFKRQVQAHVKPGDLLWTFSTSGSSPNIIEAVEESKKRGATVISFTGKVNSKVEQLSDLCLAIDSPTVSGAQELHQIAYHIICELVENQFII